MDFFYVYLLLFTELLLLGYSWIIFKGDFISPSVVSLSFFCISTICFIFNLNNWTVKFGFKSYSLFLLSFLIMIIVEKFFMTHTIVISKYNKQSLDLSERGNYVLYFKHPWNEIIFVVFIFFSFYYIFRVYHAGIEHGATSFLSAIGYNKEEADFDTIARLLYNLVRIASYVQIVVVCNNFFSCKRKITENLKELILIIMTIIITFFSGQRSSTITYIISIAVAATISIYSATSLHKKKELNGLFKKIIVGSIVLVILFFLSANIVKATNIKRDFFDYMTYYFGSTLCLMGRIVYDPSLCHQPFVGYFGEKTLMGFWQAMYSIGAVSQLPSGRRWMSMGGNSLRAGNEYTFLCAPYIDFGFAGTLVFVLLFFCMFSILYYSGIKRNKNFYKKIEITSIYIFLYTMVAMDFYQDTIRTYSRPINVLYIFYMIFFCKLFVRVEFPK